MHMTPYQFDQTKNGWRKLDSEGKFIEAAELIAAYVKQNQAQITSNPTIQTLYFHAGQEYAMVGEARYEEAITYFRRAYKGKPEWDAYVEGTIAFLRRDKTQLEKAIQNGAQNVEMLQRFLTALEEENFSYAVKVTIP